MFNAKDGVDINFDLYAMAMQDAEERKLAMQIQQEMEQENLGKKNKNLFY